MKNWYLFISLFVLLILASCSSTKEIAYFQDAIVGKQEKAINVAEVKIKPNDKISILVNCQEPQLATMFNLPVLSTRMGQSNSSGLQNNSNQVSCYTVNADGCIDFPFLGLLKIDGLSRAEVAQIIKEKLMNAEFGIKDPIVTVEYVNLNISILGEVKSPGNYSVDRDDFTILDAISKAGDLTIYGKRENIKVIRHSEGKKTVHELNLCNLDELYSSPAYHLQQNDIVYVEPNKVRVRQSTANGNNFISTSFWITTTSALVSIAVLLIK